MFQKYRILYAEDNAETRNNYAVYLKELFAEVYEAGDGQEALEIYDKFNPDILLLDINMPKVSGLELSQMIREHDKDVKIILLTAHMEREKLLQAVKLNLVDYLEKPVRRKNLEQALKEAVQDLEARTQNKVITLLEQMEWDGSKKVLSQNGKAIRLTKNEVILMDLLLSGDKEYYSLQDMLDAIWIGSNQKDMTMDAIRGVLKRFKTKLPKAALENSFAVGYKLLRP